MPNEVPNEVIEPFHDNWTYLRTELNWLDRVLSVAVAKQRQETKEIDRVARTASDRVTSHWWKGLINLDSNTAYDSPAEMPRRAGTTGPGSGNGPSTTAKLSFQQQLAGKIQVSRQQGILLGLPNLCDRLQLNSFEKNLLLMALAPEVNRRYGRLYNYLQSTDQPGATGLPTVDLILRILCRNDPEWRAARRSLTQDSVLRQYPILDMPRLQAESLLTRAVKLADPIVNYLLAEVPADELLDEALGAGPSKDSTCNWVDSLAPALLSPISGNPTALHPISLTAPDRPSRDRSAQLTQLQSWMPAVAKTVAADVNADVNTGENATIADSPLVLPAALIDQLQHLCDRFQTLPHLNDQWPTHPHAPTHLSASAGDLTAPQNGSISLFIGIAGTGKTAAAQAIAQVLQLPLFFADLDQLDPQQDARLLQEICARQPYLVLLKSAQRLIHRSASVSETQFHQFLHQRRRDRAITILTISSLQSVKAQWRQQLTGLEFPIPAVAQRRQLWQQVFPATIALSPTIDWSSIAKIKLTGGQIQAIAHEALLYATLAMPEATAGEILVASSHIQRAIAAWRRSR